MLVTQGDEDTLSRMAERSKALAASGASVRVLFRDESIPWICTASVRERLAPSAPTAEGTLVDLVEAGDVRLYGCSSSLYLWGVGSEDLLPMISGARGLIAFLADDLAGSALVLSY